MDKNSKDGVFLGDVLKQEGMKRAETHAHEVWKEATVDKPMKLLKLGREYPVFGEVD